MENNIFIYNIITQIITLLIASAGLGLSIYSIIRKNPKLIIEKAIATKQEDNTINFRFYLDNIGEKPTAIRSIEFFCINNNFKPNSNTIISRNLVFPTEKESSNRQAIDELIFPFSLPQNSSIRLEAQLKFPDKRHLDMAFTKNGQIHFKVKIRHSKGYLRKII